jgi:hypothetical protein
MSGAARGLGTLAVLLAVCVAVTACGDENGTDSSGGRAADAAAARELTRGQTYRLAREIRHNAVQKWCDGSAIRERRPLSDLKEGEIIHRCQIADGGTAADVREAGYEICVALINRVAPDGHPHRLAALNGCRPSRNDSASASRSTVTTPPAEPAASDRLARAIAVCKRGVGELSLAPDAAADFKRVCALGIVDDSRAGIRDALASLCVNLTSIDFPPGPSPGRNKAMAECIRHVSGRSAQARP